MTVTARKEEPWARLPHTLLVFTGLRTPCPPGQEQMPGGPDCGQVSPEHTNKTGGVTRGEGISPVVQ